MLSKKMLGSFSILFSLCLFFTSTVFAGNTQTPNKLLEDKVILMPSGADKTKCDAPNNSAADVVARFVDPGAVCDACVSDGFLGGVRTCCIILDRKVCYDVACTLPPTSDPDTLPLDPRPSPLSPLSPGDKDILKAF